MKAVSVAASGNVWIRIISSFASSPYRLRVWHSAFCRRQQAEFGKVKALNLQVSITDEHYNRAVSLYRLQDATNLNKVEVLAAERART